VKTLAKLRTKDNKKGKSRTRLDLIERLRISRDLRLTQIAVGVWVPEATTFEISK
jgi:hypothetical protein